VDDHLVTPPHSGSDDHLQKFILHILSACLNAGINQYEGCDKKSALPIRNSFLYEETHDSQIDR
jgi:hypothetical protein